MRSLRPRAWPRRRETTRQPTLGDLGSVLVAQERYSQVEPLLNRALGLIGERAVAHARETFRLLGNLGALYVQTGRDSAGESLFKRAVELLEQHANDDPHIVILLGNLGSVHVKNGNYKHHPESGLILEHLGVVHFRQNKLADAERELRSALDIATRVLGFESARSVSVSLNLAKVLTAAHRYDEASTLHAQALPVQERLLGSKTAEVATTLEGFARLLHAMKSPERAREMEARARRIRVELTYTRSVKRS